MIVFLVHFNSSIMWISNRWRQVWIASYFCHIQDYWFISLLIRINPQLPWLIWFKKSFDSTYYNPCCTTTCLTVLPFLLGLAGLFSSCMLQLNSFPSVHGWEHFTYSIILFCLLVHPPEDVKLHDSVAPLHHFLCFVFLCPLLRAPWLYLKQALWRLAFVVTPPTYTNTVLWLR